MGGVKQSVRPIFDQWIDLCAVHWEVKLLLCDGSDSNASYRHLIKEALQYLADRLGQEIHIPHYPQY